MMITDNVSEIKNRVTNVGVTNENLTGRAGLAFISRYITATGISKLLEEKFSNLRKSSKGTKLSSVFHQILCYFINGDNFHLTYFDQLKSDCGYTAVIDIPKKQMISSHSAKRFFKSFSIAQSLQFRKILHTLFIWQLKKQTPEKIVLGLDTMVMDNNDALKREGVDPTYKKVKGFQPIHLYWGRFIIDTIFRTGKAHSNHGNNVKRIVVNAVRLIRKHYSEEVPIVLLADTGFFDEAIFKLCDELDIGFIIGGKMYSDIKKTLLETPDESFNKYKIEKRLWYSLDFMDSRGSWDSSYRCIYTKPISNKSGQILLEFDRSESVLYTNIGMENEVSQRLMKIDGISCVESQTIIATYHNRAKDELVNRSFKNFGTEQLPLKRFAANSVFYYLMAIAFFLFESFKEDMNNDAIPTTWYPETFRRRFIDVAGKIVYSGRKVTLKMTELFFNLFNLSELWIKSASLNPVLII